jgi:hypothetical protein
MELYGIVGAAQKKKTTSGRELLEVVFYSLDLETADGKNQIIQIAFWDNIERYEKLIKKGSRMRIFVDKLKPNPQIDKNGNPVVYFNANGQAFVYVNSGGGNSNTENNQGQQNNNYQNNQQNQSNQNRNQGNNNNGNNQGQSPAPTYNQNNNQGQSPAPTYNQNNNQGNQQGYNNQQNNNQQNRNQNQQKSNPVPQTDQMSDIESFLGSI